MLSSDDPVRRVLEVGKALTKYGSNNWALTRAEALVALGTIERESRVLLGGDVWLAANGQFSATGDSWHFEPDFRHSYSNNVRDAVERARAYIDGYPDRDDGLAHFELVVW